MVTFRVQLTQALILATGISSFGRMQLERVQLLLRDRKTPFGGKQFWGLLERMAWEFVKQVKDKGGVFRWRNTRLSFVIRGTRPRRLAFTGEKWKHLTAANWTVFRPTKWTYRSLTFSRSEKTKGVYAEFFFVRFRNTCRDFYWMYIEICQAFWISFPTERVHVMWVMFLSSQGLPRKGRWRSVRVCCQKQPAANLWIPKYVCVMEELFAEMGEYTTTQLITLKE